MKKIEYLDFIEKVKTYNSEDLDIIIKAYEYAKKLHDGQFRQSGEPYIYHPLNVAYILAEMHADKDTICAGLLHDVIEDTNTTKEQIASDFNEEIANLVDGVTKLAKMSFSSKHDEEIANIRKIITSITNDVRIIIIKLADRLHNMRTLEFKKPLKQKENALETLDIFVPLAYYIGTYEIKSELEDLSLKYLRPDDYNRVKEDKEIIEEKSKIFLEEMLYKIKSLLFSNNIPNDIKITTKNIYGIYKILSEGNTLYDIHDLFALKIMVENVENCYKTLGLVHKLYHPIGSKFKDFICSPKTNMYRSLHTTVFGLNERLVQAQIRTFDMDKINSFGLATYWDINKGNARYAMQKDLHEKYQFYKSITEMDSMFESNIEFVKKVQSELFSNKIYVYTTKGEIVELPKGSTPVDFAYKLGTDIGNNMAYAIVNDQCTLPNYELKTNDIVKIVSGSNLSIFENDEIIAKTSCAKQKILELKNLNKEE